MIEQRFDRRIKHGSAYYLSVLTALIAGVTAGLSRKDHADAMNFQSIKSPTGADWSVNSLTMALRSLRTNHDAGSYLHTAMLSLTFDGLLTKTQCLCLLEPKTKERM